MKKITIILFVLLSLSFSLFGWDLVRQTQFPASFLQMAKAGNVIWTVGTGGAVARSTDNGTTWQFVQTPAFNEATGTYLQLNAVAFADENHGVIAGNDGYLLFTTDGGQNWTVSTATQAIFGVDDIKGMHYLPSGKLFLVGENGKMAMSTDFGGTFTAITTGITVSTINCVYFEETGTGYFGSGSGVIEKTTNFGVNWTPLNLNDTNTPNIYSIHKYGTRLVLTGYKGYVGYSDDEGATFINHDANGSTSTSIYDSVWNGTIGYAIAK